MGRTDVRFCSAPAAAQLGKQSGQQAAVYANKRRLEGERGKSLLRRRGEFLERPFAHQYETGGLRRVHVRGRENVSKRVLLQAAACNLALILRSLTKAGTPRGLADLGRNIFYALCRVLAALAVLDAPASSRKQDFLQQPAHRVKSRSSSLNLSPRRKCRF